MKSHTALRDPTLVLQGTFVGTILKMSEQRNCAHEDWWDGSLRVTVLCPSSFGKQRVLLPVGGLLARSLAFHCSSTQLRVFPYRVTWDTPSSLSDFLRAHFSGSTNVLPQTTRIPRTELRAAVAGLPKKDSEKNMVDRVRDTSRNCLQSRSL